MSAHTPICEDDWAQAGDLVTIDGTMQGIVQRVVKTTLPYATVMWSGTNTGRHSITLLRVIKRACPHCGMLPRETRDAAAEKAESLPGVFNDADAIARKLVDALESARNGFINLRPGTGPMHAQMTKHIVAIDTALIECEQQARLLPSQGNSK